MKQTQNDYLREWLPKRAAYLNCILEAEAPPQPRICSICRGADGAWKCLECLGRPVLCTGCCRKSHQQLPFHRVKQWNGSHFAPAWLRQVGVVMHLGHAGLACPRPATTAAGAAAGAGGPDYHYDGNNSEDGLSQDEWVDDDHPKEQSSDYLCDSPPSTGDRDPGGNRYLVVVNRAGVHQLAVRWCTCDGAATPDIQLMDMGFFPASFKRIRTVFTFQVLDDFLIENLECKTSASSFYSKLRRITSKAFPQSIPVSDSWRPRRPRRARFFTVSQTQLAIQSGPLSRISPRDPAMEKPQIPQVAWVWSQSSQSS